ncbi:hypothetical protein IFM89_019868, partial [Coptis chinensis]
HINVVAAEKLKDFPVVYNVIEDMYFLIREKTRTVAESTNIFSPLNQNQSLLNIFSYYHCSKPKLEWDLEDIFRYQLLSEPNPEWNFDRWLIHIKLPVGGCSAEQETLNLSEVDENTSEKLKDLTDVSLPGRQSGAKEWRITRSEWGFDKDDS